MSPDTVTLPRAALRDDLTRALVDRLRLHPDDARTTVDHWLRSEQAGKPCHGLLRADFVLSSGHFGPYDGSPAPAPTRLAPGRLHVDGRAHLGYPIVRNLVEAGCREAHEHGHCVATGVGVYPSGALGDWARLACDRACGLLLLAGSPPRVAAPDGHTPLLGTNPICVGLPTTPPFICDSSTSAITHGDLLAARDGDTALPPNAAVDRHGAPTTTAAEVVALLSVGASHKTFALAMAIELLCCLGGGTPGSPSPDEHGVFALFLGPQLVTDRASCFSERLAAFADAGARIPGWSADPRATADTVTVSAATHAQLTRLLRAEEAV